MKLTLKIAVLVVLVAAALQTVRGYIGVSERLEQIDEESRSDQELLARAIIPAVSRAERLEGIAAARYTLSYLAQAQERREARWVELDPDADEERRPRVDLAKIRLASMDDVQSILEIDDKGRRTLYTYALIPSGVTDEAIGTLELSRRLPTVSELSDSIIDKEVELILWFVAVVTALVLLLGVWFVGRPVSRLADHADAIGRGELDARVDLRSHDELGHLAKMMNEMAARLQAARARVEEENQAREQALEQVRHAERLATVGQLAAGVAHEVGTPLSVIRGRASILQTSEDLSESGQRHAEIIITQVDRIAKIVRGLLDFAHQGQAERRDADLAQIVGDCVDLLKVEARKKSLQLVIDSPPELVNASVDAGQIQQVVMNLVVNAIHASESGTITVGCRRFNDQEVQIWVADEGSGISEETKAKLFEPFFTTKDVGEGTGLGLAVTYGIVQEHGGRIDVDSTPGEGTRFDLFFPSEPSKSDGNL